MTINLEKRGRRIEVRSDGPLQGFRTAFPGAYLTTQGYWTLPLSLETCQLLRQKYQSQLNVGPELKRWARTTRQNRDYMAELAAAEDAELAVLPDAAPHLAEAMEARTYQRVGVRFIADTNAVLLADDPGLGKTLQIMGGLLEAQVPGPYLIIAPKTAADPVWRREIDRWLPDDHKAVVLPETRDARERKIRLSRFGEKTWLIVHPEIIMVQSYWVCQYPVPTGKNGLRTRPCGKRTVEGSRQKRVLRCRHLRDRKTKKDMVRSYPWLFDIEWGAVVMDESHEVLIKRKGTPTQRRRGADMLRLRADGIKIASSGTPYENRPHQIWGTLNWLDPKTYSAFHRWAELFWKKGGYTGFEIGEFQQEREPMLWDSLSGVALRRTKAEVAKDLPPKFYVGSPLDTADENSPVGIWLPMTGKQEQAYRDLERTSIAELDTGRLEAADALSELTRLKQLACAYGDIYTKMARVRCTRIPCTDAACPGWHRELRQMYRPALPSNKFTWTVDSLEEWGYPKNPLTKVVIVSMYTSVLMMFQRGIEEHFKTKPNRRLCTAITGLTPNTQRRKIIEDFNVRSSDTPQIMLLNVKAGGTAITLDTADRMIFISETRIPDQQKQAEDRIHRISNPRQCLYYYLRSSGTVDEGTALVNAELQALGHRLLDGRRGIEYVRHVLELSHAL